MNVNRNYIKDIYKEYFPEFDVPKSSIEINPETGIVSCLKPQKNVLIREDLFFPFLKFEKIQAPISLYNFRPHKACSDIDDRNQLRFDYLKKYYENKKMDNHELQLGYKLLLNKRSRNYQKDKIFINRLNELHILCLSTSKKLWDYGEYRYQFNFEWIDKSPIAELIKVKYEEDKEIIALKGLIKELNDKCELFPGISHPNKFAPFIKKEKYRTEQEYRLLIDLYKEASDIDFAKNIKVEQKFIEVSLKNQLFNLEVIDKSKRIN